MEVLNGDLEPGRWWLRSGCDEELNAGYDELEMTVAERRTDLRFYGIDMIERMILSSSN